MARRCIFCGSGPVTKEHAVAQWISGVLVPEGAEMQITTMATLDGKAIQSQRSASSIIDLQAKRVCGPCNHGWMGNLESQAQPILTGMFHGVATILTPADQLLLARWAAKTAIVLQYLGKTARKPASAHRRWLVDNERPSPGSLVWLADYNGGSRLMHCAISEQWLPGGPGDLGDRNNPAIQWVTFHLGKLAIQVLFLTTSQNIRLDIPLEHQPYRATIWPRRDADVIWPPPSALDDADFDWFAKMALA